MTVSKAFFGAVGFVAFLAAASPIHAQSAAKNGNRTVTGSTPAVQGQQDKRVRDQASKRQPPDRRAAMPSTAQGWIDTRPWTIEQALPGRPPAQAREVPQPTTHGFGRVPLDSGSFGFETKSQFKQNEFSDGRKVPGLETTKREDPSYFGLSLQMRTNNVPLLPLLSPPGQR
jgi:hypothetical protein